MAGVPQFSIQLRCTTQARRVASPRALRTILLFSPPVCLHDRHPALFLLVTEILSRGFIMHTIAHDDIL